MTDTTLDKLKKTLLASLGDLASRYEDDADVTRLLTTALSDLSRYKPRTLLGQLNLTAGQTDYAVPADFVDFKAFSQTQNLNFWDDSCCNYSPSCQVIETDLKTMVLTLAPTQLDVSALNPLKYFYFAEHQILVNGTITLNPPLHDLLLLRAKAEALNEAAIHNTTKKSSSNGLVSNQARNATSAGLYTTLMDEFIEKIKRA